MHLGGSPRRDQGVFYRDIGECGIDGRWMGCNRCRLPIGGSSIARWSPSLLTWLVGWQLSVHLSLSQLVIHSLLLRTAALLGWPLYDPLVEPRATVRTLVGLLLLRVFSTGRQEASERGRGLPRGTPRR